MGHFKASERYAKSLYQLAREKGLNERVLADILLFKATVKESPELASVISSPIIAGSKKQVILDGIFGKHFSELTVLFFKLIVSKGREKELVHIAEAFIMEDKKQKGIKEAVLISATPLTDELRANLLARAEGMAGGKVNLEEKIDASLIGGFVLKVSDLQLDESVKTKLSKLRDQLVDTSYIPKIDLI
jgi:F-type H+-transporting ATPase subunit delta